MPQNVGQFWLAENNNKDANGKDSPEFMGYYRDASFIKVQNILLGYNFPLPYLKGFMLKV